MLLMDRNKAAEEFAKMLFQVGVEEGSQAFFASLESPTGQDKRTWEEVKHWHGNKTDEEKQFIGFIVKEAIIQAIHGIAVNFDGAAGYDYIDERPIEFAVALRVYDSIDAVEIGDSNETIEICPTVHGADVHDIFINLADARE